MSHEPANELESEPGPKRVKITDDEPVVEPPAPISPPSNPASPIPPPVEYSESVVEDVKRARAVAIQAMMEPAAESKSAMTESELHIRLAAVHAAHPLPPSAIIRSPTPEIAAPDESPSKDAAYLAAEDEQDARRVAVADK